MRKAQIMATPGTTYPTPRPHYAALDGFRGLLALFVAVYHTIWMSWPNSSAFLNNGAVIIDLFFAFSGFLMASLYGDTLRNRDHARAFMVRRFARLMPLHLFMLAAFVAFALVRLLAHELGFAHQSAGEILPFEAGAVDSVRNLIAHLTLTHAMGGADTLAFNPTSWTVGAEFWTYAVFAVALVLAGSRFHKVPGLAVTLVVVIATYAALYTLTDDMDATFDYGFLRCIAGFGVGLLAHAATRYGRLRIAPGPTATAVECLILASSILFVIYAPGRGQFFVGPVLFVFVVVFTQDRGAISQLLSERPFPLLARISYSTYLTHVLIAIGFEIAMTVLLGSVWPEWSSTEWFGSLLLLPYLAVVIGVSMLTYRYVELPGGRWLRHRLRPGRNAGVDVPIAAE